MTVAALIADMVRAGVDPDIIGRTAEALAAREPVLVADEQAERRRARDRERKAEVRAARLRNSADSADTPSLPEVSPQTPLPNHPILPPSPPKGGSSPTDFDQFWDAYPSKVGKKAARRAWDRAKDRPSLPELLGALDRYRRAKPPDRDWCHPTTWLGQGRWADEHPTINGPPTVALDPEAAARIARHEAILASLNHAPAS